MVAEYADLSATEEMKKAMKKKGADPEKSVKGAKTTKITNERDPNCTIM